MTDPRLVKTLRDALGPYIVNERPLLAKSLAERLGSKVVWRDDCKQVGWYTPGTDPSETRPHGLGWLLTTYKLGYANEVPVFVLPEKETE